MLIQFTVKNFLSFKEETTLDLSAIRAYKEHRYNLIKYTEKEQLVKVAAIYGANASGKSNLVIAMSVFQKIIQQSLNSTDDEKVIFSRYKPFAFDRDKENIEFQIIVSNDFFEYKYGFEYNEDLVVSEWLYRKDLRTNRQSKVFERVNDSVEFGKLVKRECEIYVNQVPNDALILTFFNKLKLNAPIYSEVYNEIMSTLVIDSHVCEELDVIAKILPDAIDDDKEGLIRFLNAIDTGIKDIEYTVKGEEVDFYTTHIDKDKNKHKIMLNNESLGTIKSIAIYALVKTAIQNGKSMFVDELNARLHPLLLKFIIDLFYSAKSNAQLIYTTHDTTLLDKKFFRRDQIWFVQKDKYGYSELSSLSDFKVRSDSSFEKDYLAGVYGGIPFLEDFEMEEKNGE